MSDHITLPRAVVEQVREALSDYGRHIFPYTSVRLEAALAALATALAEPDAKRELVHPGYIIGSHWLETAYSRIAAGEAEDAVLAEVLGARGWAKREPATDSEIVREGDEHARDPEYLLDFRDGFRAAERFHGIGKEGGK